MEILLLILTQYLGLLVRTEVPLHMVDGSIHERGLKRLFIQSRYASNTPIVCEKPAPMLKADIHTL